MRVHILGICGTFMGGIALLARSLGHQVSGQDANVYPPMSTQLQEQGIVLTEGYNPSGIPDDVEIVVIGNALSRGNPAVEFVLNSGIPYTSGPQWLSEHLLQGRWVLAVAGTDGKTTTSSMLAWILDYAGLKPGFLIGGVANDFGVSARLTDTPFFVVEADEYDTAFFDKRSKFVHYRPRTAILNNLEFDHADIFPDLAAIETQFHHFVRTVPRSGRLVVNGGEASLDRVLARGVWSEVERFGFAGSAGAGTGWAIGGDGTILFGGAPQGQLVFGQAGRHNQLNALAAVAAARHAGVPVAVSLAALAAFKGVKRRLELRGSVNGVAVYDDFAHHPTAIATTIDGLRRRIGAARILAVLEPRSNTMKLGSMSALLPDSLKGADLVFCYGERSGRNALGWEPAQVLAPLGARASSFDDLGALVQSVTGAARPGDHVLVMSNGGFGGVHGRLLSALAAAPPQERAA